MERGIPAGGAGITPVARRSAFSMPSLRRGRDVAAAEILFTVSGSGQHNQQTRIDAAGRLSEGGPMTTRQDRKAKRRSLMQHLTALCVRYVERFMPDPYLFAVLLTVIVVALVALLVRGATPSGVLNAWYDGVWGSQNIFTFAFQMVLILVTGYTLAEAPPLKRAIVFVASKPTNQIQGALLCFSLSAALSLLNWGLGLVAGALVARQVAKRLEGVHFGYLIAASFMGFIVWTQGQGSGVVD
ncbi:TIGR00366 family protein [Mycobacterium ulcerans]|nr:TIGR00366 family protein [Mycobacterium ulcerans]MEB4041916.1 TIGR00366 family protein [Mycobacterium ulcerans]MEB4228961.1 TIGR00366 family protein [Mycobacterium ulcerans]